MRTETTISKSPSHTLLFPQGNSPQHLPILGTRGERRHYETNNQQLLHGIEENAPAYRQRQTKKFGVWSVNKIHMFEQSEFMNF